MSARAKRISQKDLKQPDEFVSATGRIVEWGRENPDTVKYVAIGLVALLVVISAVSWWFQSRNASANRQFYAASELYKAKQWSEAYNGFVELSENLGATDYGHLATLYAARAAMQLDKPDDAIKYYGQYLGGPTTTALEQLARLNLGRALAQTGKDADAKGEFEKALALDGPAKPEVTLELAQVEESSGAKDRALELYGTYLEDNPRGPAKDLARLRILALGGTPPASPAAQFGGANPLQFQ